MTSAHQKLTSKVLQDMIEDQWSKENNQWENSYNNENPGQSPNEVSFRKTNEIYSMLATPLKNMRAAALKDASKNCFKAKWMDEAVPNPHQVEMCVERQKNKHMGVFYRNLVELRESTRYRYQDCVVDAGNNPEKAVMCIRNYLTGIDADNLKLKAIVEDKCSKYFWLPRELSFAIH